MADAIQKTKLKTPYIDRLNPRYADNPNADRKRQQAEAFEILNEYVRRAGAVITSPPGKFVRIEVPKGSELPTELAAMGYNLVSGGSVTRCIGATPARRRIDELTNGLPSAFCEMGIFETSLSGK
jgi:hypothetical protein